MKKSLLSREIILTVAILSILFCAPTTALASPYTLVNTVTGFDFINDVEVDASGRVIVGDWNGLEIYDSAGNFIASGPTSPGIDGVGTSASGNIVIVEQQFTIKTYDSALSLLGSFGTSSVDDVAVDATGRYHLKLDQSNLIEVRDSGGSFITSYGNQPGFGEGGELSISIGPDGKIYAADVSTGKVRIFNPDLTLNSINADPSGQPQDVAVDLFGRYYVLEQLNDRVMIYDSSNLFLDQINLPSGNPFGLAVSPFGDRVYVGNASKLHIYSDDNPVPEPTTMLLLGSGLLGLAGFRKRFRKK
ncbi:PEP-CTERM sorting domain-containing protein [Thermodesulfobacteriota bacterium]